MKLLLSCVNTLVSLIGYDTEKENAFWYCPANIIRSCGISYFLDGLLIASDNSFIYLSKDKIQQFNLSGPHDNYVHSIHAIGDQIGIADTGNSAIIIASREGQELFRYDPLEGWEQRPIDAIHLNDFLVQDHGILASCFSYKPFQSIKNNRKTWAKGGHGLILEMRRQNNMTISRVVACGISCPHSLVESDGKVYCCSSLDGKFIELAKSHNGTLSPSSVWNIANSHFLRGALRHDQGWYLGGSAFRRQGTGSSMVLFDLEPETSAIRTMKVANAGEIYDILPWSDRIMGPVVDVIDRLPPTIADDNAYPPKVSLQR